jgi:CRP/FNR family transcriptional regulator, cyclic AMP receptor protein
LDSMTRPPADSAQAVVAERLGQAWLTHGRDAGIRERLAALGRIEQIAAGEVLLRETEPTRNLGLVIAGRMGLRLRVPERGAVTIMTVEPGDVVGWSAVVPPHRSTSTVVALLPSELILFDGEALRQELAASPDLAAVFYPVLLTAMARRLEGTRLQLLDLFTHRWVEPW